MHKIPRLGVMQWLACYIQVRLVVGTGPCRVKPKIILFYLLFLVDSESIMCPRGATLLRTVVFIVGTIKIQLSVV